MLTIFRRRRLVRLVSWLQSLPTYSDSAIKAAVEGDAIILMVTDGPIVVSRTVRTEDEARELIDWYEIVDWSKATKARAAA